MHDELGLAVAAQEHAHGVRGAQREHGRGDAAQDLGQLEGLGEHARDVRERCDRVPRAPVLDHARTSRDAIASRRAPRHCAPSGKRRAFRERIAGRRIRAMLDPLLGGKAGAGVAGGGGAVDPGLPRKLRRGQHSVQKIPVRDETNRQVSGLLMMRKSLTGGSEPGYRGPARAGRSSPSSLSTQPFSVEAV